MTIFMQSVPIFVFVACRCRCRCCCCCCTAALYCARAQLADGQDVLELGCGWGSMSLFMAQAYPGSRITAVSNSTTQREFITRRARDLGISNLNVITADMVDFQARCSACWR